jgi:hypothetical protein
MGNKMFRLKDRDKELLTLYKNIALHIKNNHKFKPDNIYLYFLDHIIRPNNIASKKEIFNFKYRYILLGTKSRVQHKAKDTKHINSYNLNKIAGVYR